MSIPLKYNPFTATPIIEEEVSSLFVDRDKELNRVKEFLTFHDTGLILIIGERGIGKTSFLYRLSHDMRHDAFIAMMSAQHFDSDKIGFLRGILLSLAHELEKKVGRERIRHLRTRIERALYEREETSHERTNVGLNAPVLTGFGVGREKEIRIFVKPSIYDIEETIDDVLKESTRRFGRVVLLIDDLDKLPPDVAASLLIILKPMQRIKRVFFVIAISKEIMQYMGHEIQIARSISNLELLLGPLSKEDTVHLIEKRLAKAGASELSNVFEEEAIEDIFRHSEGNPREQITLLGETIDEILLGKRAPKARSSDVRTALAERGTLLLSQLRKREIMFLESVSRWGKIRATDTRITDTLGVSRPRASQILNKLVEMRALYRERQGKFVYYSVPDTARVWLEAR